MAPEPKSLSISRYDDAIGAEAFVHLLFYDDAGRIAEAFFPAPAEPSLEIPT